MVGFSITESAKIILSSMITFGLIIPYLETSSSGTTCTPKIDAFSFSYASSICFKTGSPLRLTIKSSPSIIAKSSPLIKSFAHIIAWPNPFGSFCSIKVIFFASCNLFALISLASKVSS